MGDLPPPPSVTASSNRGLLLSSLEQSTTLPAGADEIVTSPQSTSAKHVQPQMGRGNAIFSTDLGRRAPRKLQGPPYTPVIVRSNIVFAVVSAAHLWRSKYPYQYLCIFPHAGWKINDLWDEADIHVETESFSKQVLQFIERDNGVRAQRYAQDWTQMYPELLPTLGGTMTELYDKSNPISIVDTIFVNDESREYPPVFLWHVAHIIRKAMLSVKGVQLPVKQAVSGSQHLVTQTMDPITTQDYVTAVVPAALPTAPASKVITSADEINQAVSISVSQPLNSKQSYRPSQLAQSLMLEPSEAGFHPSPVGHCAPGFPGQHSGVPDTAHPTLRVPRARRGRTTSGTFNPTTPYVENMPRVPSGPDHRQHAGPLPMNQSPRYSQAHMILNQPMGHVHHGIVPVHYEQHLVPSGMIAIPPQSHGVLHPSMMPHHAMRNPSMTHGYTRRISGPQGVPYAGLMEDMTNMPYAIGVPPQHYESPLPSEGRFNQQYTNGNALYDPYEGNNLAFRGPAYSNSNSKKYSQSGSYYPSGRQRKASLLGSRTYQGHYENDRSGPSHMNARRPAGLKGHFENDCSITQDQEYGCCENWIGPKNETVNELFVKDLPGDVEAAELEAMFQLKIGARPTSINIKGALNAPGGQKHAFVGFSNGSITKQGIAIRGATIRGLPVSITVPRRFFQKTVEVPPRDVVDAGPSPYSRFTANPNNSDIRNRKSSLHNEDSIATSATATHEPMSYSPQDARSGLHKKKKGKQAQQGSATASSPESRKTKPKKRQELFVKDNCTESTSTVSTGAVQQNEKADDLVAARDAAPEDLPSAAVHIQQPLKNEATPADKDETTTPSMADDQQDLDAIPPIVEVRDATTSIPSITSDRQQQAIAEQLPSQSQLSSDPCAMEERSLPEPVLMPRPSAQQGPATVVHQDPVYNIETDFEDDSSSHTTARLQTNSTAKAEPGTGSEAADQGLPPTLSQAVTNAEIDFSPPSHSKTKIATDSTTMASEAAVVSAAALSCPVCPDAETAAMASLASQEGEASTIAQGNSQTINTNASDLQPAKKGGAQRTESLHPFSKQSKAQAKKEKEQKKKAQKRDREQIEKAKIAKTAANKATAKTSSEPADTTKTSVSSESAPIDEATAKPAVQNEPTEKVISAVNEASVPTEQVLAEDSSTEKPTSPAVPSGGHADNREKSAKRKGKMSSTPTTPEAGTTKEEDEDHGKQTGGTVSVPNELSSVTNKEVKIDLPENAPASDAQSSEPMQADDASGAAKVVRFTDDPEPAAQKKRKPKTKKKKKAPAWPNLDFRPKTPNPSWMGPIDMATDVQDYDEIMNRACGGEDDSDFSWSDLPEVEDEMDYDENLDEGDEDAQQNFDAIKTRIAELQSQQAASPASHSHNGSNDAVCSEATQTSNTTGAVVDPVIATLQTQIAATNSEIDAAYENIDRLAKSADTKPTSSTAVTAGKKKKPNNRKNKKKKKAAENAEAAVAAQAVGDAEASAPGEPQSSMALEDSIDSSDPFYNQLKEIEDTKRGDQGTPNLRGGHGEATKTRDEPQLMRTMEAYFKETQGSVQSKARKMSQKDLYN